MDISDAVNSAIAKVQLTDKSILEEIDVGTAVKNSLPRFSKDSPKLIVSSFSGNGGYDYALPLTWQDGFSVIKSVEYPAGERYPAIVPAVQYQIYDNGSTKNLRFLNHTPSVIETIRIAFTAAYLSSDIASILAQFEDIFCVLAASNLAKMISKYHAFTSNPTIMADVIKYDNKSGEWAKRAKELLAEYEEFMDVDSGGKPAMSIGDWDGRYQHGENFQTHN